MLIIAQSIAALHAQLDHGLTTPQAGVYQNALLTLTFMVTKMYATSHVQMGFTLKTPQGNV